MQIDNRTLVVSNKRLDKSLKGAEDYRHFLYGLAKQLGMNENDSRMSADSALRRASRGYLLQYETYSLKVWLAKLLVRDCVFQLNSALFSESNTYLQIPQQRNESSVASTRLLMSARVSWILCCVDKFTEGETALILNTSVSRVKQALGRVRMTFGKFS